MKISELLKVLKATKKQYGDIDVCLGVLPDKSNTPTGLKDIKQYKVYTLLDKYYLKDKFATLRPVLGLKNYD